jgi:hypothetical protein
MNREIQLLTRLAVVEMPRVADNKRRCCQGAEITMSNFHSNDESEALVAAAAFIKAQEECLARAAAKGLWCYFCGLLESDSPTVRCPCGFQESFGCGTPGRRICGACSTAHRRVADFLRELFAKRAVNRVSSVRMKLFHILCDSAAPEFDDEPNNPGQRLRFYLSPADPFDEDLERFRTDVVRAFRRARLLDFQGLVRELNRAKDDFVLRATVKLLEAPTRRTRARIPKFAGSEFNR